MKRTIRGDMPLCDKLICRGLLLARRNDRMGDSGKMLVVRAQTDFFALPEMREHRLSDQRAILHAIEQTLLSRTSFYTVQRRFELPIERPDRFSELRRLYCICLLGRFGLYI